MISEIIDFIKTMNENNFCIEYKINKFNNSNKINCKKEEMIGYFEYENNNFISFYKIPKDYSQHILVLDELIKKHLNEALISNEDLNKLSEITNSISPKVNIEETVQLIMKKLCKILDFNGAFFLLKSKENYLSLKHFIGIKPTNKNVKISIDNSVSGLALKKKTIISLNNPKKHPLFAHGVLKNKINNIIYFPIFEENGDMYGVISIINKKSENISIKDMFLSIMLNEIIASIMEVSLRENKLKFMLLGTLKALLKAQNSRIKKSPEEHLRIKEYVLKMADKLNLNSSDKWILELSSYIYDIGMIGLPNALFTNSNKLSTEEYETVKKHVEFGYQLAEKMQSLPNKLKKIILYHHERWNGSGYPNGLKEDKIPLLAQIIGICDTYVAMTENRAYRKKYSKQDALKKLKENSGILFNPILVDTLSEVIS
ncbi:hypothetical protein OSSY52_15250 [Tepiditoga spiralis]|uniref:HD-GYP domain-containing protein n=1 Tax=Tepiditoga spiralis TaxID=2108365 RepID=A0A7G1G840_9BACT|nr:HD domain-containing phosphohydrolase [Tepiditoga spiralis]BBE31384.1 hypothetical protein OSSY52_15250 [Tepiditoga spiralis]